MTKGMLNTLVVALWKYLKIFAMQEAFFFGTEPFDRVNAVDMKSAIDHHETLM